MDSLKSKECNACNGRGKVSLGAYYSGKCYVCSSKGVVTEDRFKYLTQQYWPSQLAFGAISQLVCNDKIAELTTWWEGSKSPVPPRVERAGDEDPLLAI